VTPEKNLIVNADDLGWSPGVNRAIAECHAHGVLTSASLMVTGRAIAEAVRLSRRHPRLSVGLHWDVWGEDEREFDLGDVRAVRDEFARQLETFYALMGRLPTHVDSHRHAHRDERVMPVFEELVEPLGVPLRGDGRVRFVGKFYAQWEWKKTEMRYVSPTFLGQMLADDARDGWTEFSCHPGFVTPGYDAVYDAEREVEARTLIDESVRRAVTANGITLASYTDWAQQPTRA